MTASAVRRALAASTRGRSAGIILQGNTSGLPVFSFRKACQAERAGKPRRREGVAFARLAKSATASWHWRFSRILQVAKQGIRTINGEYRRATRGYLSYESSILECTRNEESGALSDVATAILLGDSHLGMHACVDLHTSKDNTERLQRALDLAGKEGGGTILLPAGVWPIVGSLRLPDNVTLRGVSTTASVLRRLEGDGPSIEFGKRKGTSLGEGCALESLTLDVRRGRDEPISSGVLINGDAAYGIVRHVKISNMNGDGIRCEGGSINCLYLEGISIESCLGSSIYLQPDRSSSGIFLSDISIRNANPIKSSRPCAVWLRGRCMISQLQVDMVRSGHIGVFFDEGSDFSLVSGLYVGGHHDETVVMAPGVKNVPLSNIITRRGPRNLVPNQPGS